MFTIDPALNIYKIKKFIFEFIRYVLSILISETDIVYFQTYEYILSWTGHFQG